MAARSALKNKKNQKMREAIGDIAVQCGDTSEGEGVKVGIFGAAIHTLYITSFARSVNLPY